MNRQSDQQLIGLSSDEGEQSGGEVDSDEDVITDYHLGEMLPRSVPLPTISVTPHSPANKTYPVLEDSLQQVRELHDTVQRMRDVTATTHAKQSATSTLNPLLGQVARLSASCPTLNEAVSELETLGGSLGSSPLHQVATRKGSGAPDWLCQPDPQRRRSWTALEDLTGTKEKAKHRQRSISLSSMESEADESSLVDMVDGSTARLLGADGGQHRRGTRTGGGASTHSLNEADLQSDFIKVKAKCEAEQLRLSPVRLPLQKSVSTPSIIAVRDLAPEPALEGAQPTVQNLMSRGRLSYTESETEEEGRALDHRRIPGCHPLQTIDLHHTLYGHHSEKRRKRGSIFFRKKKDKNKKVAHQWISACYGSSHNCDHCSKPLSNKPALFCENCSTTVHQNACKDSISECAKPGKSTKTSSSRMSNFGVANLANSKSSLSKRGSGSFSGSNQVPINRRNQLNYSPWRRVATKLGVNQILSDEKDVDHCDSTIFNDDAPLVPLEFLSDTQVTAGDLCKDLSLGLHESEPDSWTPYVGKDIARKLKEKEVKRQEHIYEFILTEKHHCMTLLVMQKIFLEGLQRYFNLGTNLERMFPRLNDLIELHLGLLSRLRQRQRESPVVSSIVDILLDEFSNLRAAKLKSAYGEFCSRYRDAVELYKGYMQSDQRFGQFVRHCQQNPLLKKKGIPECILFVTQRLTKYPLLIEPLIKTSKENKSEQDALQRALALVKEILVEVDAQVAEKEKEDRKLDIYNKIDAKSHTIHRDHKFKKSDILQGNRSLRFEGLAMLMQGRGKMQIVLVIVLSDVLFFLQENNNKYTFFTPDNKAGVVSLQKLLVREKAGQESRGIYLISSNPADPEMFELKVHKPKDKQVWINAIRHAVQNCPEDEDESSAITADGKQSLNMKQSQVRHLSGLLRQKDMEQALLLEEKMSLQLQLLATSGIEPPSPPSYRHLVSENADTNQMWKDVLTAVHEVSQLASLLFATGTNLSRSVSSAGEHQSEAYVSPILPKRAETFGGYDATFQGPLKLFGKKLQLSGFSAPTNAELENIRPGDTRLFERLPYRNCMLTVPAPITNGSASSAENVHTESLLTLGREQQYAAVHLSHYVYTLLCIISQLMTTNESLQAQMITMRGADKYYKHNQHLEELRNLQDKLSVEKAAWAAFKEQESKELEEKRNELLKMQEQMRADQNDIAQQREQLYRKMEVLTSQGLLISPNVALPVAAQLDDSSTHSSEESSPQSDSSAAISGAASSGGSAHSTAERRKDSGTKWQPKSTRKPESNTIHWAAAVSGGSLTKPQLPLNLISTTNQQKVSLPIKQQIPLKLASRLSNMPMGNSVVTSPPSGQQMLPLKLCQDEKVRRSSTGYQRLGSDSFSPPSGETVGESSCSSWSLDGVSFQTPTTIHSHIRTGSSPAMMLATTVPTASSSNLASPPGVAKVSHTNAYPKHPDKYKSKSDLHEQQQPVDEEVMYF